MRTERVRLFAVLEVRLADKYVSQDDDRDSIALAVTRFTKSQPTISAVRDDVGILAMKDVKAERW